MLLKDLKILITGVVTKQSIAYHIAKKVQEFGGEIILTAGPGKTARLTERMAQTLDPVPTVLQMDVTNEEQIKEVAIEVEKIWGSFNGLLHAVAYAPSSCIGGKITDAPWTDVATAFHISSYSLAALGRSFAPLMKGGSIVALDFDASEVWEYYNWMGVCKAGLESISRYLARDLGVEYGIRVNCIAAGPLRTVSAKAIQDFATFETLWKERSVLDWSVSDGAEDVADAAVFLFSGLSKKITGEKLHVDGGFHIMGSPVVRENK